MFDPIGAANTWIAARHFYKKSSDDLAGAVEELKDYFHAEFMRMVDPLLKHASTEQRETIMSTVENSTTALVNAYMSTVKEPFSMTGSAETSVPPKVIDSSAKEPEDMGPGRTGG